MANRPGRPTKINKDRIETVCALVRAGNYIETAVAASGITRETLYEWLRRGEAARHIKGALGAEDALYLEFSDSLKKAVGEAETTDLDRVDKAADSVWQAAAWRLERRHPDRWSLRIKTDAKTPEQAAKDLSEFISEYLKRWHAIEKTPAEVLANLALG